MTDFAVPNSKPGKCAKCNGSGKYRWGGAVVNGVWKGKEGDCYSCGGTGVQTRRDIGRNVAYNRHKMAEIALAMAAPVNETDDCDARHNTHQSGDCNCGSGLAPYEIVDARGIYVTKACDRCRAEKTKGYRPEIFTNPNYWHDEPL